MNTAWFIVLGALLTGYAILDGIDLGIGSLHLLLGKSDTERRTSLSAIGPFWAGYEVWLVVAGGSMIAAFPRLYAASFSGFYLVLTLVLWLLIARGTAIELRGHMKNSMWRDVWDVVFSGSSMVLALLYGAALGNVIRGVPLNSHGDFQGSFALTLNPYALLVGLLSVALLAMHGANYLAARVEGDQEIAARRWAMRLWPVVLVLTVAVSVCSFFVRPHLAANFLHWPVLLVLPLASLISLVSVRYFQTHNKNIEAVFAGAVLLGCLMACAGASLYPLLLPALGQPKHGLDIYNAAAPHHNLVTALVTNLIAMSFVIIYHIIVHRIFRGKIQLNAGEHGY